jgi:regulator of protease activity HflC (stomatin/prohibitin superfamily)
MVSGVGIVIAIAAIVLLSGLKVLNEYERAVVFRLGRLNPFRGPGVIFVIPILERAVRIDLRTVTLDIPPQDVITRDNVTMKVSAVLYFRVIDPSRAVTEVRDYLYATMQLAQTTLRSVGGQTELDDLLSQREKLNAKIQEIIDAQTEPWGIKVVLVELKNIDPPQDIKLTMEKQMTAERSRRAVVTTAEGEKSSAILKAEGQKQSQIVNAEGEKESRILEAEGQAQARLRVAQAEAQAIQVVAEAIGGAGNPAQYLIAQRYLEAFAQLGANADRIVYLPYEASGILASLGGIRELLTGSGLPPMTPAPSEGPSSGPRSIPPPSPQVR